MSRVAGSLLEEMADNPAKVGDRLAVGRATKLVERELSDHDVRFVAHGAVTTYRSIDRRFVVSHACCVLSGEAPEHPRSFGVCYVVDQPQKRRAGSNWRVGRLGVIDSVQLLHQRVPLVPKQRGEDGALVTCHPRRLLVRHNSKL